MNRFLLATLALLFVGPVLGNSARASANRPGNPAPAGIQQAESSGLPTRLMIRTKARGWFGLLGVPAPEALQGRIEERAGFAIAQVDAKDDYQLFTFERRLDSAELADAMGSLAGVDGVVEVFEDVVVKPLYTPNDSHFILQTSYYGAAGGGMNLQAAWDVTTGSSTTIAVIDTGKIAHPDLDSRWIGGYDFISSSSMANDGDGRDADATDTGDHDLGGGNSWHGAHVSGSIGAVGNNGLGVAGVNWQARILPVRVLGAGGGYLSDVADGLRWSAGLGVAGVPANPNPARIANLSLGGSGYCDSYMQNAINQAVAAGTIVVVAAGNSSGDIQYFTPAGCQNVIVVGSNNNNVSPSLSYFSNYGAITLTAPGEMVFSTVNDGSYSVGNPAYGYKSGTSMATPHVAGAISLILAVNPGLTQSEIIQILQQSARAWPSSNSMCGQQNLCGAGILNVYAAVQMAQSFNAPTPMPPEMEPIIGQITPRMNVPEEDASLTIYGANFTDDVSVIIGASNFAGEQIAVLDSTHLDVFIPANSLAVGNHSVQVCWTDGECNLAPESYRIVENIYPVFLPATLR